MRLGAKALELVRVADQALDRPGERGRGRLVTGGEQGQQLVADFGVAHRAAVLVAGGDQHREDVVALLEVLGFAAGPDLGVDQPVDAVHRAAEPGQATDPPRAEQGHRDQLLGVAEQIEVAAQGVAQLVQALALAGAEDGAQDDLQGQRLHARAQRVGLAARPALDLTLGDRGHDRLVGLHALAVERRQQQLALTDVPLLVEHQQRAGAEQRLEQLVALAGVEDARVAGEDLLDRVGAGEDRPGVAEDLQREDVAVAVLGGVEQAPRLPRPDRRLHRHRQRRPGGKAVLGLPGGRSRCRCRRSLHRASDDDATPSGAALV